MVQDVFFFSSKNVASAHKGLSCSRWWRLRDKWQKNKELMETGFDFHITLTQYVSKMFKLWKRKNSGSQGWTFIRWREWKCFMIHIIRRVKISKVFNNVAQFPVAELKRQAAKGLLDLCSVIFGLNYIFSINSCSGCQDISVFILLQAVFGLRCPRPTAFPGRHLSWIYFKKWS